MDGGNAVAGGAGAVHRFLDGTLGGTPADEEHIALGRAVNGRRGKSGGKRLQFFATLGGHFHVQVGRAGGVAQFVVLWAGGDGRFAAQDAGPWRDRVSYTAL